MLVIRKTMPRANEYKSISDMIKKLEAENDIDLQSIKVAEETIAKANEVMGRRHYVIDALSDKLNNIANKNVEAIEGKSVGYCNCVDCKMPMPLSPTPQRCKGCTEIVEMIDKEMGETNENIGNNERSKHTIKRLNQIAEEEGDKYRYCTACGGLVPAWAKSKLCGDCNESTNPTDGNSDK